MANARLFNPYVPGVEINNGLKPLFPPLWEMDTMKGEQFPAVAAEPLKALNPEFTRFQIKVRPGIYWSDGVEFTVEDIAFTIRMLVTTKELPTSAYWARILKPDMKVVDKYTLEVQTVEPVPAPPAGAGDHDRLEQLPGRRRSTSGRSRTRPSSRTTRRSRSARTC